MTKSVEIVQNILDSNDRIAAGNKEIFNAHQIFAINMMASPGAGKTSFILRTIEKLPKGIRLGVIEGDTAPVTIDSDKVVAAGMPADQINTGGN